MNEKMSDHILAGNVNYNFATKWLPNDVVFKSGKNSSLFDDKGNSYLDFYCNFGSNIFGHSNKEYLDSVYSFMCLQNSNSLSYLCEAVAATIKKHVPSMEKIRFGLSGTEVVNSAIRLSRAFTGKRKLVRFVGHYHGHTDNILGGVYDGIHLNPVPFREDPRGSLGTIEYEKILCTILIPWNDPDLLRKVLDENHDEIACVIMEPINLNGGGIHPNDEFLNVLTRKCSAYGILLIFDEIITGVRTGLGGMQEKLAIKPDLSVMGKALSGGICPVSVIGGRSEIMNLLEEYRVVQAGTYNGYHMGMGAVSTTMTLLAQNSELRLRDMWKKGAFIRQSLVQLAVGFGIKLVTQGHDGGFCLHIHSQPLSRHEDWTADMRHKEAWLQRMFFEEKILLAPVLRFYMNTDVTDNEINELLSRSESVFKLYVERFSEDAYGSQ
jgi:glutamate-1-semialdehyde 2,1-aminomutase